MEWGAGFDDGRLVSVADVGSTRLGTGIDCNPRELGARRLHRGWCVGAVRRISLVGRVTVDEPDGFEVEILRAHAPFVDDVAAQFRLKFEEEGGGTIVDNLKDASTLIVAEVTWDPNGSSGWHFHPGVALVNIVEG